MTYKMVFDVESVGLHGEGYAVGYVVVDPQGVEVDNGAASCPSCEADGALDDREWVEANVDPHLGEPTHSGPQAVRSWFWSKYQDWKTKVGLELWTDCGWPVEANFLSACVADKAEDRKWAGPYPLLDVAVALKSVGVDPLGTYSRLPSELPAHNPLADARQSARLLGDAQSADRPVW